MAGCRLKGKHYRQFIVSWSKTFCKHCKCYETAWKISKICWRN